MRSKVECTDKFVFKFNTSRYSKGLEWVTESLSINHKRELRVYSWYSNKNHRYLKLPKVYEMTNSHLKLEKLNEIHSKMPKVNLLIPSIIEFTQLGNGKKRVLTDFLSSPTQSVIRGVINHLKFLGLSVAINALLNLFKLYIYGSNQNKNYLIHKDLKIDQNMVNTAKGVYFIDFGSSIITKNYFLTDIVELSIDHKNFKVNFRLIEEYITKLKLESTNIEYLRSQVYLLLLRRFLHLPKLYWVDRTKIAKVKKFLTNLNSLVLELKIKDE